MSFEIDPVKAATTAYKNGNCGLNKLNNACFSVCAAFEGASSPWDVSRSCAANCNVLNDIMRREVYGQDQCDHPGPVRPVLWGNIPHYFPSLYSKMKNVENARCECIKMCDSNLKNSKACRDNCMLDSYAIVEKFSAPKDTQSSQPITIKDLSKKDSTAFWIGFGIGIVVFLILVHVVLNILTKE